MQLWEKQPATHRHSQKVIRRKKCMSAYRISLPTSRPSTGIPTQSALQSLHMNMQKLNLQRNSQNALSLRSKMLNMLLSSRHLQSLKSDCVDAHRQIMSQSPMPTKLPTQSDFERLKLTIYKLHVDIGKMCEKVGRVLAEDGQRGQQGEAEQGDGEGDWEISWDGRKELDILHMETQTLRELVRQQRHEEQRLQNLLKIEKRKEFEFIQVKRALKNPKEIIQRVVK